MRYSWPPLRWTLTWWQDPAPPPPLASRELGERVSRAPPRPPSLPVTAVSPVVSGFHRHVYSVQGVRVTSDALKGWQCECHVFATHLECEHIPQARLLQALRRNQQIA